MANGRNLILLGKTGSGKSACGNTILQKKIFLSTMRAKSTTQDIAKGDVIIGDTQFTVYDTPGLFDTGRTSEDILIQWESLLQLEELAPTVYLLVTRLGRFTAEENATVQQVEEFLGERRMKNTWILFTGGDQLEHEEITIKEFIVANHDIQRVVERFNNRYHVFNNHERNAGQVMELIMKISMHKGPHPGPLAVQSLTSELPKRRLVLLGKTGAGKSASGNTILGEERFESELSCYSVTAQAEVQSAIVAERLVSVVDTPGLFDTDLSQEDIVYELGRSIYECSPGPHALVIVLPLTSRFSPQEKQVTDVINAFYGEKALQYTIILFTFGDQLEGRSVEHHIQRSKALSNLVNRCGGRYHVFNNKDKKNRRQVIELLEKIDMMVDQNGEGYYRYTMLEDAARCRAKQAEQVYWEEMEHLEIKMGVKKTQERIKASIDEEMRRRKEMEEERSLRQEMEKELESLRKELSKLRSQATPAEPIAGEVNWRSGADMQSSWASGSQSGHKEKDRSNKSDCSIL